MLCASVFIGTFKDNIVRLHFRALHARIIVWVLRNGWFISTLYHSVRHFSDCMSVCNGYIKYGSTCILIIIKVHGFRNEKEVFLSPQ